MRRFWDERAKEDAYYFVDNRLDYGAPDVTRFWDGGEEALSLLLDIAGASIEPEHTVLDIGCGLGRLSRAAAGRAQRVLALDVSEEMLSQARELNVHLRNVEWIHGDGHTVEPLPDASVDCCISLVVFQHIPDPAITLGYLREIGRVLRPGGFAAFQLSTHVGLHRPNQSWRSRLRSFAGRGPRGQSNPAWVGSAVPVENLRAVCGEAGLELERLEDPGTQYTTVHAIRR
jgi:SAM-dependent methyltransferase